MENYPYFSSLLITLQTSPSDILLIYEFSNKFSCFLLYAVDCPRPPSPNLLLEVEDPAVCSCVLLWQDPAVCPQGTAGQLCNFPSSPLSQHLAIHGYEFFSGHEIIFLSLASVNSRKAEFLTLRFCFVSLPPNLPLLGIDFLSSFFSFKPCHSDSWFLDPSLAFCNSSAFSILSQMKSLIQQGQQDPENWKKMLPNYKLKIWGILNIRTIYMKMYLAVY